MNSGIYAIVNTVTGDHYIGQAARFGKRFNVHLSQLRRNIHRNVRLQRAWNKYGSEQFVFVVVEQLPRDAILLEEKETMWMDACRARGITLYNINPSGRSSLGRMLTTEHKQKLSAAKLGKTLSDAHRKSLSMARKGKPKNAAWRAKISAANKGQVPWCLGKPSRFKGVPIPDERKKKISVALKKYRASGAAHPLIPNFVKSAHARSVNP